MSKARKEILKALKNVMLDLKSIKYEHPYGNFEMIGKFGGWTIETTDFQVFLGWNYQEVIEAINKTVRPTLKDGTSYFKRWHILETAHLKNRIKEC
ncbi:MAG: hypothetical protein WC445_04775 [Patescibacteria group bacterium]